jgi:hypothetical protein
MARAGTALDLPDPRKTRPCAGGGRCAAAGARLFTQIARPLSGLRRHKRVTGCLAITAVVPVATRRLKHVPDIDALHRLLEDKHL